MFTRVLLMLFCTINGAESTITCNGQIFHGVYHEKELLFEGMGKPYNLVMHTATGLLFFSHTIWNGAKVDFGIMYCHLENKTCSHVPGIPGGYAIAHDRIKDNIFFGGHNGIYKYNFRTKSAKFFAEKNKSIWGLFVGRYFYYIEYPTQRLYKLDRNKFVRVESAKNIEVDNFFMSRQHTIYFSNITALYKVDRNFTSPIVLKYKVIVRQITEDMFGDIYFCTNDGIYVEVRPYHKINKVADIENAYGLTFLNVYTSKTPRDLIIYSSQDSIYRLLPSKHREACMHAITNEKRKRLKVKTSRTVARDVFGRRVIRAH